MTKKPGFLCRISDAPKQEIPAGMTIEEHFSQFLSQSRSEWLHRWRYGCEEFYDHGALDWDDWSPWKQGDSGGAASWSFE